eukprot:COSAG05_NODE_3897_length_1783_cov_3.041568_1_plen_30_part_10
MRARACLSQVFAGITTSLLRCMGLCARQLS